MSYHVTKKIKSNTFLYCLETFKKLKFEILDIILKLLSFDGNVCLCLWSQHVMQIFYRYGIPNCMIFFFMLSHLHGSYRNDRRGSVDEAALSLT